MYLPRPKVLFDLARPCFSITTFSLLPFTPPETVENSLDESGRVQAVDDAMVDRLPIRHAFGPYIGTLAKRAFLEQLATLEERTRRGRSTEGKRLREWHIQSLWRDESVRRRATPLACSSKLRWVCVEHLCGGPLWSMIRIRSRRGSLEEAANGSYRALSNAAKTHRIPIIRRSQL